MREWRGERRERRDTREMGVREVRGVLGTGERKKGDERNKRGEERETEERVDTKKEGRIKRMKIEIKGRQRREERFRERRYMQMKRETDREGILRENGEKR